ncbi:MAG: reverse transcriptase domain-containing protein [Planctomycetaceae bacterium]
MGIQRRKVNWIVDADIRGFFDNIDHSWLLKFLEHRIADPRLLRLLKKWLRAGVSEDGHWSPTKVGTPQGAVISPLLANVFLHYVLDLWMGLGPVDGSVAETTREGRSHHRALCG